MFTKIDKYVNFGEYLIIYPASFSKKAEQSLRGYYLYTGIFFAHAKAAKNITLHTSKLVNRLVLPLEHCVGFPLKRKG